MARSLIANAQRCVNLFPEINPKDSPAPTTHYPTPGLVELAQGPVAPVRGVWAASNGEVYAVIGSGVYFVGEDWSLTSIGTIPYRTTPVSMRDNGTEMVLVDGSSQGWSFDLVSKVLAPIVSGGFYGGDIVEVVDQYFILNRPGTKQFYISRPNTLTFEGTDIASKTAYPDPLVSLGVMHRDIWLLGSIKSEVWYNAGGADFPFQITQGVYIEEGCLATHSIARAGLSLFWLSKDATGQPMILAGANYRTTRISTHALEVALASYSDISDAVGMTYSQEGHIFYVLALPSADKTWVYDLSTQTWHERMWLDSNGVEHRHRANCMTFGYGKIIVGDHSNGKLYHFDLATYTDDGAPILRIRSLPHLLAAGKRVTYNLLMANIEVGTAPLAITAPINLRWSNDKGKTWGPYMTKSLGLRGDYNIVPTWNRLGLARDRVFELSWSAPVKTALASVFIDAEPALA